MSGVVVGGALVVASGCGAAEEVSDHLRPVGESHGVPSAPPLPATPATPATPETSDQVPETAVLHAGDPQVASAAPPGGEVAGAMDASQAGTAGMPAAGEAPDRVEFPVPTVPARTAAIDPADQPAVDVFRSTWATILDFYGDLDVAAVEPVHTLSDELVEVWVAELTRWRARGAVRGVEKTDSPSWQRIEAVRRLDAHTVELEYCSFVNLELRDAAGGLVLDGNSFLSREIAVMREVEGQWFWSTTYNDAPVAGELVRDCAWRSRQPW
ncbi:MAG: hypothetical protein GX868_10250 [Actinobacteria bacterium]|nr:hypothetical protein [Actinomycetota bacterium]